MKKSLLLLIVCVFALSFVLPSSYAYAEQQVYLGGTPLGIRLVQQGLVVDGFAPVGDAPSPAQESGVKSGDILLSIDDRAVNTRYDVQLALSSSQSSVVLALLRDSEQLTLSVTPAVDSDGQYKLGLYLTEGLEGLGTLTFVTEDLRFGALGHGIYSGTRLSPTSQGAVYTATISGAVKGAKGKAGELKGEIGSTPLGELLCNDDSGVYGEAYAALYATRPTISVAPASAVHTGDAVIVSTIEGDVPNYYAAKITSLQPAEPAKGISLVITDSRLLVATNGIVQGMSGSPILQDGKLVGAVTHVTLDNPKVGYGIFITQMLMKCANRAI